MLHQEATKNGDVETTRSSPNNDITTTTTTTTIPTTTTTSSSSSSSSKDAGHRRVRGVDTSESACERYTSCRWVLAYMGGMMTLLMMCLRNCISMAIVCISNTRYVEKADMNSTTGISNDSLEGDLGGAGVFPGDSRNGSVQSDLWNGTSGTVVRGLGDWWGVLV